MDRLNASKPNRRPLLSLSLILAMATLIGTPALAQDAEPSTRIVADPERDTITFIVDGKTVGQFTQDGLSIFGDVAHSGSMTATLPEPAKAPDESGEKRYEQ